MSNNIQIETNHYSIDGSILNNFCFCPEQGDPWKIDNI